MEAALKKRMDSLNGENAKRQTGTPNTYSAQTRTSRLSAYSRFSDQSFKISLLYSVYRNVSLSECNRLPQPGLTNMKPNSKNRRMAGKRPENKPV